jgi:hypothetical protein
MKAVGMGKQQRKAIRAVESLIKPGKPSNISIKRFISAGLKPVNDEPLPLAVFSLISY